ncbi:tetratricopeptide repeat protein [Motiliproteus sediminis]|uniref:tetratricopeptide repeat protein n=1 Tax=Motiliproteus sediminis TaxID=1468178 RepID=UPI001AEF5D37|nr:tetratricopeptide repeat protein [Motiliproteus sediminis]
MTRVITAGLVWLLFAGSALAAEAVLEGEQLKQERLGFYYFGRGDVGSALRYLLPVAEAGHALSQYRVGSMEEAATNFEVAEQWYQRAIKQGVPEAAHALAGMYANGLLGPKDLPRAFELEMVAAEQGFELSMNYVANAYARGLGVEQNLPEAVAWYRKAADQGSVLALKTLIRAHKREQLGFANDPVAVQELESKLAMAEKADNEARIATRQADFETLREIEKRYLNGEG